MQAGSLLAFFGAVALLSSVLLACSHERVDLWGSGARRAFVLPVAGMGQQAPPAPTPAVSEQVDEPPVLLRPAPIAETSPLRGLASRSELVPPISGGTLAVAADGSVAVAADPDRDLVYVVDLERDNTQTLTLPAKSEPGRVVLDDQGQAHVLLRSAGQLARITLEPARVVVSEPICQYPRGLAYSAATRRLHVACADGQLVQLTADTHSVLTREQLATDLRDVVLGANDTRVVSRFRNASWLFQSPTLSTEVRLPDLPWPAPKLTSASNASAEADRPGTVLTRASFAFRTVAAPDGTLWMLHERSQQDPLLQGDDYSGKNTGCGPVVQPALTHFDPARDPAILDSLQLHGASAPAMDLAISHDGRWLALVTPSAFAQNRSSAQLHRIDNLITQGRIRDPTNSEFANTPSVICSPPGNVGVTFGVQSVAVAFDQDNLLYIQNRFPARLDIVRVLAPDPADGTAAVTRTERELRLNDPGARDLGHEWFHAELGKSRVSCAACHAEGLDDAHTWRSSKGPRRTPSLRGGLRQTAPFTWDGEHSSLDAVITQQIAERLGVHDVPAEAVSGIASWLDKLPALTLQPQNTSAADSGRLLFESSELGCASCHSGPQLTNNQTIDVGTGAAFQVPSLLGLSLRAPYMHDGCAEDLRAIFTVPECAGQGHAGLGALSGERAANLEAYLRSL